MHPTIEPAARLAFGDLLSRVEEIGRGVIAPAAADVDVRARFPHEALDALRAERLLSAYLPVELGGMGLSVTEVSRICEVLGRYCASAAMVFAMHQIQVAALRHHAGASAFFRGYLAELAERQLLLASATTEAGVGGDLGSSICALEPRDGGFTLTKTASVISYALEADGILATCRRSPEAAPGDQVLVLVRRGEAELEQTGGWDTLGFRGTCSSGFVLRARGQAEQVVPAPFSEILGRTMQPFSHVVWGSLWLGIAQDAVDRARAAVLRATRQQSSLPEVAALRLVEVDAVLFQMRSVLYQVLDEYQRLLDHGNPGASTDFGLVVRLNHAKVTCSELVVEVVGRALRLIGISAYHNGSENSLSRHLRDAYGAAIMVNNDRLRRTSSALQLLQRRER